MTKKIIMLFVVLCCVASAMAYYDGQVVTQGQVSAFNFSNYTVDDFVNLLECRMENNGSWMYAPPLFWHYGKTFSCFQLDEYDEGYYIIKRNNYTSFVTLRQYENCLVKGYTVQECRTMAREWIDTVHPLRLLKGIWLEIKKYQEIITQPDDLGIGGGIW